jgi:hypothetical protein
MGPEKNGTSTVMGEG